MELESLLKSSTKAKQALGSEVEIETVDRRTHRGTLHCIDPVSSAVVLATGQGVALLNINSVQRFKTVSPGGNFIEQRIMQTDTVDGDTLRGRREKLRDWFKLNLIDIEDDGEVLRYKDHLVIEPPYDAEHCYCTNTIILERIYDLINKMPPSQ